MKVVVADANLVPYRDLLARLCPAGTTISTHPRRDRLPQLLAESDAVVLGVPLLPETEGMIGAGRLRAMKPSAVLVNIGRGPLCDEQALYEVLRDRVIAGAAIDARVEDIAANITRLAEGRELENLVVR
ncbi:NAD(P)-dependent oxidoreductase [Amycolatopsis alkalitolerans]|uniref:D-isomer specific 2-hydroxyacid dehydrogenase NAD-binding domain-containing protein n=1 Tax=Amycolatopsis alkalitolerans TaxID=2547244 RepID=A0A5C4M1L9_9PSEU|nr:NAD(P)-dependent oxidoreductase [Amycolatopsis alkalitolerans]TNC26562.1 hypothetical protein FG385_12500 [Amycolatopsis alkalitolerans]